MKQLFIQKGKIIIEDTPLPQCDDNCLLVRVTHSVISVGTEKTSLTKSKKDNIIAQFTKKPGKAHKIINIIKKKGITP